MSKTFGEIKKTRNDNYALVVDGINLAFRYLHQKNTKFVDDYIRTIQSLAQSYGCAKVIVLSDWGSSSYRLALHPGYKSGRKAKYENESEEDKKLKEEFFREFDKAIEKASALFTVLRYKGVEADDIAAYIVKKSPYEKIWLISSDKDWDLLISDKVSRFSTVTRKEVTVDNWEEHYDVSREQFISLKCLQGDAGDSIPGIPQIGPKRAAQLIEQYGSALDIYEACPLQGKQKYITSLNENKEQILLNYQLMDLISFCEDAIGQENIEDINKRLSWQ